MIISLSLLAEIGVAAFLGSHIMLAVRYWPREFSWRTKRTTVLSVAGVSISCFALTGLLSLPPAIGAISGVVGVTAWLAYKEEESFRRLCREFARRLKVAVTVLVWGTAPPDTAAPVKSNQASERPSTGSGESPTEKPWICVLPPRPAEILSPSGEPTVQVLPAVQPPEPKLSDAELLKQLLGQVSQLQQHVARPSSDRERIQLLVGATKATESALREASDQLQNGTVNWCAISQHVDGLRQHEVLIPADIMEALKKLVEVGSSKLDADKGAVARLSNELRDKRDTLAGELSKPVASPQEALHSAEEALALAARIAQKDQ